MFEPETLTDRLLRKAKAPPLCGCEKCGTTADQLWERAEVVCARPFLLIAQATLWGLIAVVVVGLLCGGIYIPRTFFHATATIGKPGNATAVSDPARDHHGQ